MMKDPVTFVGMGASQVLEAVESHGYVCCFFSQDDDTHLLHQLYQRCILVHMSAESNSKDTRVLFSCLIYVVGEELIPPYAAGDTGHVLNY